MTGMQNDWKDARSRCNIFRLLIGLECGATMFSQLHVAKFISVSKRVLVSTCYDINLAFVYIKDKDSSHFKMSDYRRRFVWKTFIEILKRIKNLQIRQLPRFRRSRDAKETCRYYALNSLKNLLLRNVELEATLREGFWDFSFKSFCGLQSVSHCNISAQTLRLWKGWG